MNTSGLKNDDFNDDFFVLYSNVDSLLNKRGELDALISIYKPKVICLTEIMPKVYTNIDVNTEFHIKNYALFTNDPPLRGVAIYVLDTLNPQIYSFSNESLTVDESVWCSCNYNNHSFLIGNVYRNTHFNKLNFISGFKQKLENINNNNFPSGS